KINKKLSIKNRLFNQVLAETIVDPETGEVLAEKGQRLERKLLNKLIPYIERQEDMLGEEVLSPHDGVLGEDIILQKVKIYDPTDPSGERVINVIGNGNVDSK